LALDNKFVGNAPLVLDAGIYGDEDVLVFGELDNGQLVVEILEGAFIRARQWTAPMEVRWKGTTPTSTFTDPSSGVVILEKGVRIIRDAAAGGPMWVVEDGVALQFACYLGGALQAGAGPLLQLNGTANVQLSPVNIGAAAEADTISGDAASTLFVFVATSGGAGIYFPQPTFFGTLLITTLPFTEYVNFGPYTLNNVSDTVTIDIAAPVTVFLDLIDRYPAGFEITFAKIDATGAVATIDANGATINGALTTTLTAQYSSLTLQKHAQFNFGPSQWIIVGAQP